MRELKFIISGQTIRPDPSCDFSGMVPGTDGYLMAVFAFDSAWDGCAKIAEFRRYLSSEPISERIKEHACVIPAEVLTGEKFKLSVVGIRPGYRIVTNKLEVKQDG